MSDIAFHREGDFLIPDLIPPESPRIGIWGTRRKQYLQQYHDGIYTGLLLSGKLNAHLEEIDRTANEVFGQLMQQYTEREGVTEQLKSDDELTWVQTMNAIRAQVEETIRSELIYK